MSELGIELAAKPVFEPALSVSDRWFHVEYLPTDAVLREGLARFDGGRWLKLGIVLSPDPNTWEGSYIAANGSLLRFDGRLWYWYVAGPRERPRLGLARSTDGRAWRKEPL